MSVIKNPALQTGVWNAPQIIPFDSLFTRYSVEKTFDPLTLQKMIPVLEKWKASTNGNLSAPSVDLSQFAASTEVTAASSRNCLVYFEQTPMMLYKVCMSTPNGVNPLSNALRPAMGKLVQNTIDQEGLTGFGVPKEGVFPIASKEEILKVKSERTMNRFFIVCAEKKEIRTCEETIAKIKEKTEAVQTRLADQACKIPLCTGLTDFRWHNLQMDKAEDILWVLDTEPLFGELLISPIEIPITDPLERLGSAFSTSAEFATTTTLELSAKKGLTRFFQSSEKHDLHHFLATIQTYLEKV